MYLQCWWHLAVERIYFMNPFWVLIKLVHRKWEKSFGGDKTTSCGYKRPSESAIISLQRLLLIWVSRIQVEKQSQLYTLAWGELFIRQCKSRFGYHNNLYTLLAVNPRLLVTGCWTTPPTVLWNLSSHVPRYTVCTLLPYKIKRHLKALQGPQF